MAARPSRLTLLCQFEQSFDLFQFLTYLDADGFKVGGITLMCRKRPPGNLTSFTRAGVPFNFRTNALDNSQASQLGMR